MSANVGINAYVVLKLHLYNFGRHGIGNAHFPIKHLIKKHYEKTIFDHSKTLHVPDLLIYYQSPKLCQISKYNIFFL